MCYIRTCCAILYHVIAYYRALLEQWPTAFALLESVNQVARKSCVANCMWVALVFAWGGEDGNMYTCQGIFHNMVGYSLALACHIWLCVMCGLGVYFFWERFKFRQRTFGGMAGHGVISVVSTDSLPTPCISEK